MNINDLPGSLNVIIEKYRRYISTGIVCLMFGLLWFAAKTGAGDPIAGAYMSYTEETDNEELLNLIDNYYKAYASGDTETLEKYASPISEKEKSYIQLMSDYIKSYTITGIYTKPGVNKNDCLASVAVDIDYKKLKEPAPGLDFFYITKGSNGKYHINNLYSTFNSQNAEMDVDPTVITLIAAFERQDDVTALQDEVTQRFNQLVLNDNDFNVYFTKTLPDTITDWAADYKKSEEKSAKKQEKSESKKGKDATAKADDGKKNSSQKDDSKKDDSKKDDSKNKESDKGNSEKDESSKEASSEKKSAIDVTGSTDTVVTTDKVNIRQKPSTDSRSLGQAAKGTKFTRIKEKDGWSQIEYDNDKAWISSDYVKVKESKNTAKAEASVESDKHDESDKEKEKAVKTEESKKADDSDGKTKTSTAETEKNETVYTTDKVNVRTKPDQSSASLGQTPKDTKLVRYREKNGWSQVEYNGRKAWIRSDFITQKTKSDSDNKTDKDKNKDKNKGKDKDKDKPKEDKSSNISPGQDIMLKSATNVRSDMSESADRIAVIYYGNTVTVVKVYDNGWSKVKFRGKEGYIKTEFLQ